MEGIGRRKFVKTFLLAGGTLIVPKSLAGITNLTIEEKDTIYLKSSMTEDTTQAKEAFYRREYNRAETLFLQMIQKYPHDILSYNGVAKVYRAQQKLLECCRLWENATNVNSTDVKFWERYARILVTVVTGDHKAAVAYANEIHSDNLAEKALYILINAINTAPDQTFLHFSLQDAIDKLETYYRLRKEELPLADSLCRTIADLTDRYIGMWQETQNSTSTVAPLTMSTSEPPKSRRILYFESEQICRAQSLLKKAQAVELNKYDIIREGQQLPQNTYVIPSDTNLITPSLMVRIRKDAFKVNDYRQLYEVTKRRLDASTRFWNVIAHADAIRLMGADLDGAISCYRLAENKLLHTPQFKKISAVYMGMAKAFFQQGRYDNGRDMLLTGLNLMCGVGGNSLHFIVHYAKSYYSEENLQACEHILVGLTQKYQLTDWNFDGKDPIFRYIFPDPDTDRRISFMQSIQRYKTNSKEMLVFLFPLARLYKRQNNEERFSHISTLIRKIDPLCKYIDRLHATV